MSEPVIIHWFRQDLRLADNPSLYAAAKLGTVLPIFILDEDNSDQGKLGSTSRWWLHHSLNSLNLSLSGNLNCYCGNPLTILEALIERFQVKAVYWNRCYEPWRIERDRCIKTTLASRLEVKSFNSALLWEPWQIKKADGSPYKVFTAYYRNARLSNPEPVQIAPKPEQLVCVDDTANSLTVEGLDLLPTIRWDKKLEQYWSIGETAASSRFDRFITESITGYQSGRDFPALDSTSKLSAYLHFGEISPRHIWHYCRQADTDYPAIDLDKFVSEIAWREFSYYLLYHFPLLPSKNFQAKFDRFPWLENVNESLIAWQTGQTGYPLVDAGMRELWETGYMHNRVRMIVASFLVKNLLIHWHHGHAWFNDCLVDADLANNSASWQWVAGSGADAAPYFRIFNPTTQGQKFDAAGVYTRRFVPELAKLPNRFLFCPWQAPDRLLDESEVTLGVTYPHPIVDLAGSRKRALNALNQIKQIDD